MKDKMNELEDFSFYSTSSLKLLNENVIELLLIEESKRERKQSCIPEIFGVDELDKPTNL